MSWYLLLRGGILFLLAIQSKFWEFLFVAHMLGFGKLRSALESNAILSHSLLFLFLCLVVLCLLSSMVNTSKSIPLEIVFSLCVLGNLLLLLDLLDVLDFFHSHINGSLSFIFIRRFKLIISCFSIFLILLLYIYISHAITINIYLLLLFNSLLFLLLIKLLLLLLFFLLLLLKERSDIRLIGVVTHFKLALR